MQQTHRVTLVNESLPQYCTSAVRNCKTHQLPLEKPKRGTRNELRKWHLGFRASHLPTAFSCRRKGVTYRFDPESCFLGIFQSLDKSSQPVGTSIPNQANPKPVACGPELAAWHRTASPPCRFIRGPRAAPGMSYTVLRRTVQAPGHQKPFPRVFVLFCFPCLLT